VSVLFWGFPPSVDSRGGSRSLLTRKRDRRRARRVDQEGEDPFSVAAEERGQRRTTTFVGRSLSRGKHEGEGLVPLEPWGV